MPQHLGVPSRRVGFSRSLRWKVIHQEAGRWGISATTLPWKKKHGGGIFLHLFQWDSRPPSRVYRPIFAHISPTDPCLTTVLNCTSRPSQQHRKEEEKAKTCKIGVKSCLLLAFYMRLVALGERGHDGYEGPGNLDGPIGICNLQIVSICSTRAPSSF